MAGFEIPKLFQDIFATLPQMTGIVLSMGTPASPWQPEQICAVSSTESASAERGAETSGSAIIDAAKANFAKRESEDRIGRA